MTSSGGTILPTSLLGGQSRAPRGLVVMQAPFPWPPLCTPLMDSSEVSSPLLPRSPTDPCPCTEGQAACLAEKASGRYCYPHALGGKLRFRAGTWQVRGLGAARGPLWVARQPVWLQRGPQSLGCAQACLQPLLPAPFPRTLRPQRTSWPPGQPSPCPVGLPISCPEPSISPSPTDALAVWLSGFPVGAFGPRARAGEESASGWGRGRG